MQEYGPCTTNANANPNPNSSGIFFMMRTLSENTDEASQEKAAASSMGRQSVSLGGPNLTRPCRKNVGQSLKEAQELQELVTERVLHATTVSPAGKMSSNDGPLRRTARFLPSTACDLPGASKPEFPSSQPQPPQVWQAGTKYFSLNVRIAGNSANWRRSLPLSRCGLCAGIRMNLVHISTKRRGKSFGIGVFGHHGPRRVRSYGPQQPATFGLK